jgi:hypothetical protein
MFLKWSNVLKNIETAAWRKFYLWISVERLEKAFDEDQYVQPFKAQKLFITMCAQMLQSSSLLESNILYVLVWQEIIV